MLLKFWQMNDDFILTSKPANSSHNLKGISQIHTQNAVEKSDNETEFNVICEPEKPLKNFRMY